MDTDFLVVYLLNLTRAYPTVLVVRYVNDFIFNFVACVQASQARLFECRNVNKNVLAAVVGLNKAIPVFEIKPLHCSFKSCSLHRLIRIKFLPQTCYPVENRVIPRIISFYLSHSNGYEEL